MSDETHGREGNETRRTLWQKDTRPDDWVIRYTVGDDYAWDNLLLPYDVRATRAHVDGLLRVGILDGDEHGALAAALNLLLDEWNDGRVTVAFEDEDCHTVIERFLTKQTGDAGGKVHTGRSRNDQVLAALRLFEREKLCEIASVTLDLVDSLTELARATADWLMPGYTHTQRAMPSTLGLWMSGYAEILADDAEELVHAARRCDRSPLGSGAGYGIPHIDLDRRGVAEALFHGNLIRNSTAVQLGRGKIEAMCVAAAGQLCLTLNRLATDLILFVSAEFGFAEFPEALATGSSIMPHKKNPDVLEIARASSHRLLAEHSLLVSVGANLPSGYHRDLQLTKAAAMRGLITAYATADAMTRFVPEVRFVRDRLDAAVSAEMLSAGNALMAAAEGTPFREAYRETARVARPTAADILATYRTPGTPGLPVVDPTDDQVRRIRKAVDLLR